MRLLERLGKSALVLTVFGLASYFAVTFGTGGLWRGLEAAHAVTAPGQSKGPYDLTQLAAVNKTLDTIRKKYVDPKRIDPRGMLLGALNFVQGEVAQVIVLHEQGSPTVRVRVETEEQEFRVDNVQGPWDVAARLREVFAFLQTHLQDADVELREVEYAACNGMLRTLDPHSVFMSPEGYREMNLSTSGHFGGLGIVISIRDQMLTIMRPMPGTPAGRGGLRRLDRITKINNESTLNMPLDDAVARLRGKPGSPVTVWIHREGADGWTGSRPFELVREEIQITSVDVQPLGNGVGYVRIKQFQSSTADELDDALKSLRKQGQLKGLVLDLRNNPGGLLDQAAKVADRFLDRGVIVSTVGASEGREEKRAIARGTEPTYGIVVLANGSSASASEIVAGALKNHDRAIVVGEATFGKGSVQLVFPNITPDGAALKLTIAQYLTPGDVSIQGVGVPPDIELDPMTADTLEMDLFSSQRDFKERDLAKSLDHEAQRSTERPTYKVRYNLPETERAELRDRGGDIDDEFRLDFSVKLARDLAGRLPPGSRAEQLRGVKAVIDKVQRDEIASISGDLGKLGIDWAPAPEGKRPALTPTDLETSVKLTGKGSRVVAGEPLNLEVTVKNNGTEPVHRLHGVTKSDLGYFDEKELVFGKIAPGESRTATAPLGWCEVEGRRPGSTKPLTNDARRSCKIPKDAVTRVDPIRIRFDSEGGVVPKDAEIRATVEALPAPIFAYTYQLVDHRPGNGDGQVARGEGASVYLTVKNVGTGRSHETQANLRNLTGDGLLLRAGRFDISNMKPGDVRQVVFTFDALDSLRDNFVKVELSVHDRDLRVGSSEKLSIPVTKGGTAINEAKGRVSPTADADVLEQPRSGARVVATLQKGAVLERIGRFDDFAKVDLQEGRFGFVEARLLEETNRPVKIVMVPVLVRSPPALDVSSAVLSTRADTVRIEGVATDADRVLDAYAFAGSHKVFYQSNRAGLDPRKLKFAFDVRLRPGVNLITVVARESSDTVTRRSMVVRKDGPGGETLPTPKQEAFGADWEFSEGD